MARMRVLRRVTMPNSAATKKPFRTTRIRASRTNRRLCIKSKRVPGARSQAHKMGPRSHCCNTLYRSWAARSARLGRGEDGLDGRVLDFALVGDGEKLLAHRLHIAHADGAELGFDLGRQRGGGEKQAQSPPSKGVQEGVVLELAHDVGPQRVLAEPLVDLAAQRVVAGR